jgi:hypothetical protein
MTIVNISLSLPHTADASPSRLQSRLQLRADYPTVVTIQSGITIELFGPPEVCVLPSAEQAAEARTYRLAAMQTQRMHCVLLNRLTAPNQIRTNVTTASFVLH